MALTAHDWRLTPLQFEALATLDKTVMMATTRTRLRMVAWENRPRKKRRKWKDGT